MVLTGAFTWLGYVYAIDLTNQFTGTFFADPPTVERFWHWPLLWGWTVLMWLYAILSRVIAFYLAFVLAYSLTTPGYVVLSTWTADRYSEQARTGEAGDTAFSFSGAVTDLVEGIKIGAMGLVVTVVAVLVNCIPVVGQIAVFVCYALYSALMFVDFPASRYRWTLGRKIGWLRQHFRQAFRLGIFPALISLVPVLNIFLMALFFPLFTIHTTLNFLEIEGRGDRIQTVPIA